jgi:hypothetical protein
VDAFMSEPVELRRFEPRLRFHETEGVVTVIVTKNENDIAGLRRLRAHRQRGGCESSEHLSAIHGEQLVR